MTVGCDIAKMRSQIYIIKAYLDLSRYKHIIIQADKLLL